MSEKTVETFPEASHFFLNDVTAVYEQLGGARGMMGLTLYCACSVGHIPWK